MNNSEIPVAFRFNFKNKKKIIREKNSENTKYLS